MSLFTTVISKIPKRNAFDLSFENLLTSEFGQIVPISCKEMLPNDTFRQKTEVVVKTAPMLAPIYSRIDLYLHYFFVPQRLLQTDFEDFITTGVDGLDTELTPPYAVLADVIQAKGNSQIDLEVFNGTLKDYLGIPPISLTDANSKGISSMRINMLPFLAYQKIYSDWFRDELLDPYEFEPLSGGYMDYAQTEVACTLRYRSWKKDYFTSARPSTQLGEPIPIPISGELSATGPLRFSQPTNSVINNGGFYRYGSEQEAVDSDSGTVYAAPFTLGAAGTSNFQSYFDGIGLSEAGVYVNDLRRALRLQEWQERNMRGGNRYIENMYHHFGVKSSDARLQRSELIGGRKIPIVIQEVTQTSANENQPTPLAQLAGKASGLASTGFIKWHAEEHGFLICLASIMPKPAYFQGLPRMFWRMSYLDYAWPLFGNLGEQEVYNGELYLNQSNPDTTFGYQSRYAEYKFSPNEIHGAFRSDMAYWHNARIFDSAPVLNNDFVQLNGGASDDSSTNPQNRIFPTLPDGYGHFYLHVFHDIKAIRPLPRYGIPSI